jgi:hypothetical protein
VAIPYQQVLIHVAADTRVALALHSSRGHVIASAVFPSGALRGDGQTSLVEFLPVDLASVRSVANPVHPSRVAQFGASLSFEETLLSPLFRCRTRVNGAQRFPFELESYVIRFDNGSLPAQAEDVCLARVSASGEWICETGTYEERKAEPAFQDDGRSRYLMRGRVRACQDEQGSLLTYGFILSPLQTPPVNEQESKSLFERNRAAIVAGLVCGIVFLVVVTYVSWRLYRYRTKYKEQQRAHEELKRKEAELDETAGGLGIAQEGLTMVANPLVVEMQTLEEQLEALNITGSSYKDNAQLQAIEAERMRLQAEIDRVRHELDEQKVQEDNKRRVGLLSPSSTSKEALLAEGAGPAAAAAARQTGRQEFGGYRAAKKAI